MALTRRITKAQFDKLSDVEKAHYKADADEANYTLDLTDYEDPAELRRARDREKQDAADLRKELGTTKTKLAEAEAAAGDKNKDVQTLERSWTDKFNAETTKLQGIIDTFKNNGATERRSTLARDLAHKLATDTDAAELLLPHIERRISVEFDADNKMVTKITDKDGKISALTLSDLEKETLENKSFARIIKGSKASGGGAPRDGNRDPGGAGGRSANNPSDQSPSLAAMTPAQLVEHLKTEKEGA